MPNNINILLLMQSHDNVSIFCIKETNTEQYAHMHTCCSAKHIQ